MEKKTYLQLPIEHLDIRTFDARPLVEGFRRCSFQARNLARACDIYEQMLREDVTIILCLAGSLISAGMKRIFVELLRCHAIDVIVSTGANMVDMDFFEALGFRHYLGSPLVENEALRQLHIDRIYDTYIDEDELRICDETMRIIADSLEPRPYSSRELTIAFGRYLAEHNLGQDSILRTAYELEVPIFLPSFSDCSAGFGFVAHQVAHPGHSCSHDSVADFRELTSLKAAVGETGMFIMGGGVPKNFTADTVVCAEILGKEVPMHKYALQLTVADERDGALSGSTLKEAHSWGKIDEEAEQMVWGEATLTLPLLASAIYHRGTWKKRQAKRLNRLFAQATTQRKEPAGRITRAGARTPRT
jgi:deoxyhypusine synthase